MKSATTMKTSTTHNTEITQISTNVGSADRKEGLMASTFESQVREFAAEFSTPNVKLMVQLCEQGRISWAQAYEVSRKALAEGLKAVA